MLRFTDGQVDWRKICGRLDAGEQLAQPLERVRLQAIEIRIQGCSRVEVPGDSSRTCTYAAGFHPFLRCSAVTVVKIPPRTYHSRSQAHEAWRDCLDQIVQNGIGHRFVKRALVAIRPHVKLQAFQLDVALVGNEVEHHRREVRLAGQRTQARELRNFHSHPVIALRRRVGESFEDLRGACGHAG